MRRALLVVLLLAGCAAPAEPPPLPDSVAVLGDSISRAMNAVGQRIGDNPASSWATGSAPDDGVTSIVERVRLANPTLEVVGFNDARSGARVDELAQQAEQAARQRAQHVVVLIGANDACASPPTSAEDFRARYEAAAQRMPEDAVVYALSVPDVTQLVDLFADNASARAAWDAFGICPPVLRQGADVAAARERIEAYNDAIEDVARERGWRHDDGALFALRYRAEDVSTLDYFHPSLAGQARLAEEAWSRGPYADRSR